ncbi:LytTR family transcriptional regulator DNA-binding domain-containing protein [Priestia koreensis]|uniref:LytTR family transcriptional regulator DNA-binding domain-containing protein n=1 Tax=Priestia koreensis TaxID=284581 RepID=UPI0030159C52
MKALVIEKLEKRIGNQIIFPAIDLTITSGEVVAVQCNAEIRNQFIHMLVGGVPVSAGRIMLNDEELPKHFKKLCENVGLLFAQEAFYDRLSVYQYLSFYKRLYAGNREVDEFLKMVGLLEKKKQRVDSLTFSEKKRLQLARIILHDPDLLVLEEPTQNIDLESQIIIKRVIAELVREQKIILVLNNYVETAIELTSRVYSLTKEGLRQIEVKDEGDLNNGEVAVSVQEEGEGEILTRPIRFEKIPAKVNEKIILFDPTEIAFVESHDGVSHLHVKGETFPCTYTLNELFDRLQMFGFFRCHRSYIVNLQKVREVITWTRNSYSLVLDDAEKTSIPLSKGKLNELKDIIGL